MAANYTHQCPHCGTKSMHFPLHNCVQNPNIASHFAAFSTCQGCNAPVCMEIVSPSLQNPIHHPGNIEGKFVVIGFFPKLEETAVPEFLPKAAVTPFVQAAESKKSGHYDAAGAMYRKTLDVALKKFASDLTGTLYNRIEKLAADNKITPSLKDWAHGIRLDGNDAAHDEKAFTKAEADEMHAFTTLLLTYLFTLPEKIRLKGGTGAAKADQA